MAPTRSLFFQWFLLIFCLACTIAGIGVLLAYADLAGLPAQANADQPRRIRLPLRFLVFPAAAALGFVLCVVDLFRQRPLRVRAPAQTQEEAQEKWLELVDLGRDPQIGIMNAILLMSCFQVGDPVSPYARILKTGRKEEAYGHVGYHWIFKVEEPLAPGEVNFVVTVSLMPNRPEIRSVMGKYKRTAGQTLENPKQL
jgi:hypothetical protein